MCNRNRYQSLEVDSDCNATYVQMYSRVSKVTNLTLSVRHQPSDIAAGKTLRSTYLEPLEKLLDVRNAKRAPGQRLAGLYDQDPNAELVLAIDIVSNTLENRCRIDVSAKKDKCEASWSYFLNDLQPSIHKGYVTMYDRNVSQWCRGPLIVVGTGATPLHRVYHQSPRDVFYDAPLRQLTSAISVPSSPFGPGFTREFSSEISPITSSKFPLKFYLALLLPYRRSFNPFIKLLQLYSSEARARGLEPRWWELQGSLGSSERDCGNF